MRIIRKRRIVEDDWTHVDDGAPLPETGNILVSLERWRTERDALLAREGGLGVRLPNTIDPQEIADDLQHFAVVAVEFPIYRDGRGFSIARLLRERLGYRGEVRAIGNVLRDQLFFMERCGFDAYEVQEGKSLESALEAFGELSVSYQDAIDRRTAARSG
jgi:uncharacterized protein (DUF934 family)